MKRTYRWEIREADERKAKALAEALKLPPLIARLLSTRGYDSPEAARRFLEAGEESFRDPFEMKDMEVATERIRQAIRDGQRIRVYGDYDADGVTSTALMTRLLRRFEARFDTYIPHRAKEGYGLNVPAIEKAAEDGVKLIVTVDNGISAVGPIARARELGIDVVVTDHHEPPAELPEAVALVNPKRKDCPYPFKGLSGAGVAFKLAHAMLGRPDLSLADVAAIGTVADLMPLEDENRVLVKLGLEEMALRPSPGMRALAAIVGTEPENLTSGRIAFGIAPRLNAGGRLDRADGAVQLLVTDDEREAERQAERLDELNRERQQLVDETLEEAERLWADKAESLGGKLPETIVLAGEGWNAGIAGLVASKLVERYYRPVLILAYESGAETCKGSARSIEGFDLHAALTECAELMEHFGGHQAAAGLTIRLDRLAELESRLCELAREWISAEDWVPRRKADMICSARELNLETAELLRRLEPYGNGNPTPRFVVREASLQDAKAMGKEGKHLRLVVEEGGRRLESVGFGMGEAAAALEKGMAVDVLGELAVNEWNGTKRAQLMLQDWRHAQLPVYDRRTEKDWLRAVVRLAEAGHRPLVLCASRTAYDRARESQELATCGAVVSRCDDALTAAMTGGEMATAASAEAGVAAAAGERHGGRLLVVAGLPERPEAVRTLESALASGESWEAVYVFDPEAGAAPRSGTSAPAFPGREAFGRVYGLFRKKGAWVDAPDGFLRQAAEGAGLPLSVVRLMQEVFEELGFLTVDRSNVKVKASPAKRELDQSERYRRAKENAELSALCRANADELKRWIRERARLEA